MFDFSKKPLLAAVLGASVLALSVPASSVAQATPLAVEVQFTLSSFRFTNTASDEHGLLNSTFLFRADFADNTTYVSGPGAQPIAIATSHSFSISGASVPASNGVYSDPNGAAFFPTCCGFFDPSGGSISIPGFLTIIRFDSNPQAGINVGDLLTAAHLNTTYNAPLGQFVGADVTANQPGLVSFFDASDFIVRVFDPTSSTVPEPGTLALFGLGLAGFGFARRWRRRKAA